MAEVKNDARQQLGIPDAMSVAAARFFAADWESGSFLEFFVDLQLRVSEESGATVGRTLARLADHARYALQATLVRGVDSYFAYLAEISAASFRSHPTELWTALLADPDARTLGVPVNAADPYLVSLAHGNVRRVDRIFEETTGIRIFQDTEALATITRLVSLRNLISHGRTFAADDLAALVDETVSVGGLGLRLRSVRLDLEFLRTSVARVDSAAGQAGVVPRPISRDQFFAAISAASQASHDGSPRPGQLDAADDL